MPEREIWVIPTRGLSSNRPDLLSNAAAPEQHQTRILTCILLQVQRQAEALAQDPSRYLNGSPTTTCFSAYPFASLFLSLTTYAHTPLGGQLLVQYRLSSERRWKVLMDGVRSGGRNEENLYAVWKGRNAGSLVCWVLAQLLHSIGVNGNENSKGIALIKDIHDCATRLL